MIAWILRASNGITDPLRNGGDTYRMISGREYSMGTSLSPTVRTGSGAVAELETLSPLRWCLRNTVPSIGETIKVLA